MIQQLRVLTQQLATCLHPFRESNKNQNNKKTEKRLGGKKAYQQEQSSLHFQHFCPGGFPKPPVPKTPPPARGEFSLFVLTNCWEEEEEERMVLHWDEKNEDRDQLFELLFLCMYYVALWVIDVIGLG